MIDKFECQSLDSYESGTVSFDFCSECYSSCTKRCRDYGECFFCVHHNNDSAVCANCLYYSFDCSRS